MKEILVPKYLLKELINKMGILSYHCQIKILSHRHQVCLTCPLVWQYIAKTVHIIKDLGTWDCVRFAQQFYSFAQKNITWTDSMFRTQLFPKLHTNWKKKKKTTNISQTLRLQFKLYNIEVNYTCACLVG